VQDRHADPGVGLTPVLILVFLAFCVGVVFNLLCFGLLQWSEPLLSYGAARVLTRIIWWPVAVTCGADPRDLFCALPGVLLDFLFHWLVAFGLLWWQRGPRSRAASAALPLK
jgi:hypothetical protein